MCGAFNTISNNTTKRFATVCHLMFDGLPPIIGSNDSMTLFKNVYCIRA